MDEEKKDILDFFFDGDIIIAGAQGYTNISKILETGNYMFAINDSDSDLNGADRRAIRYHGPAAHHAAEKRSGRGSRGRIPQGDERPGIYRRGND